MQVKKFWSNPKWNFNTSCSPKVVFEMSGAKVAFHVYNGCFCGSRAFLSGMYGKTSKEVKFARFIMGVSLSACCVSTIYIMIIHMHVGNLPVYFLECRV